MSRPYTGAEAEQLQRATGELRERAAAFTAAAQAQWPAVPASGRIRVTLVGCVGTKGAEAVAARDLYTSPLFRLRRRYAERRTPKRWAILSALHGLVEPSRVLRPYNTSLAGVRDNERQAWAMRVVARVRDLGPLDRLNVEIHAGLLYWRHLEAELRRGGAEVDVPTRGMGIGRQLHWYGEQLPEERPSTGQLALWPEIPRVSSRPQ